jgi:hypothetical protein
MKMNVIKSIAATFVVAFALSSCEKEKLKIWKKTRMGITC